MPAQRVFSDTATTQLPFRKAMLAFQQSSKDRRHQKHLSFYANPACLSKGGHCVIVSDIDASMLEQTNATITSFFAPSALNVDSIRIVLDEMMKRIHFHRQVGKGGFPLETPDRFRRENHDNFTITLLLRLGSLWSSLRNLDQVYEQFQAIRHLTIFPLSPDGEIDQYMDYRANDNPPPLTDAETAKFYRAFARANAAVGNKPKGIKSWAKLEAIPVEKGDKVMTCFDNYLFSAYVGHCMLWSIYPDWLITSLARTQHTRVCIYRTLTQIYSGMLKVEKDMSLVRLRHNPVLWLRVEKNREDLQKWISSAAQNFGVDNMRGEVELLRKGADEKRGSITFHRRWKFQKTIQTAAGNNGVQWSRPHIAEILVLCGRGLEKADLDGVINLDMCFVGGMEMELHRILNDGETDVTDFERLKGLLPAIPSSKLQKRLNAHMKGIINPTDYWSVEYDTKDGQWGEAWQKDYDMDIDLT